MSTATVKLLHDFGFVCVLFLGYAVCIFHTTDAEYVVSCWLTQIAKGNVNPGPISWLPENCQTFLITLFCMAFIKQLGDDSR